MCFELLPLKGKRAFSDAFKAGRKFYEEKAMLVVGVLKRNAENVHTIKFAVSTAKKYSKKAVVRNRIKRLLRESTRRIIKDEQYFDFAATVDYLMLYWKDAPQRPGQIELKDVYPVVQKLFDSAKSSIGSKKNEV